MPYLAELDISSLWIEENMNIAHNNSTGAEIKQLLQHSVANMVKATRIFMPIKPQLALNSDHNLVELILSSPD